jgi:multidrug efflux pump subunit AcrA (membrane-fusion protein)
MSAQGFIGATLGALLLTGSAALAERSSDSYILSEGDASWCTSASVKDILAVQGRISGRFLWVRRAGREYLVREPGTLDQAFSLFASLRLDEPEREQLRHNQARLDAERDALESQQQAIEEDLEAGTDEDDRTDRSAERAAERRSLEKRQEEVHARLAKLDEREAELEAEERVVDARDEAREAEVEAGLWRLIDQSIASGVARPVETPASAR